MGWILLILGLAIWWAAHLFKRVMPARRAAMGNAGRGVVTVAILASIVLMVLGFRAAPYVDVWTPPAFMIHINNLLMLIAIWMMSPAGNKGLILNKVRHPMLMGFRAWAVAHLLVNGDLASILLFGGLFGWAFCQMILINRDEPDWTPDTAGTLTKDIMFLAVSGILMLVIGLIHNWLGYWPFPSM